MKKNDVTIVYLDVTDQHGDQEEPTGQDDDVEDDF